MCRNGWKSNVKIPHNTFVVRESNIGCSRTPQRKIQSDLKRGKFKILYDVKSHEFKKNSNP